MAKASRVAARQAKAVREIAERLERLEKKVDFIVSAIEAGAEEMGDPFEGMDEVPDPRDEAPDEASVAETDAEDDED